MADTGLLGFNPYGKATVLDFSSKPVQVAIQLQQKEAAKKEALDKYFMDYEKSINPAGMRGQDQDVFLSKLGEAKSYYLKNRDKILNPAKYGAEAQSQYMAMLKGSQSLIEQSKQAAGEEKAFKTYMDQIHKSGKSYDHDQLSQILNQSRKAIGQGYVAPDAMLIDVYDPYDHMKMQSKLNSLKTISGTPKKEFISKTEYYWKTPENIDENQLKNLAYNEVKDRGYRDFLNEIVKDTAHYNQLNDVYKSKTGIDIPKGNINELSYANMLSQAPTRYKTYQPQLTESEKTRLALARQKTPAGSGMDTLKYVTDGANLLQNGDESIVNDYFNYWKSQNKGALNGQIGFIGAQKVGPGVWKFNYNIAQDGIAIPTSTTVNANDPAARNNLFALQQQFLGSDVKAEKALAGKPVKGSSIKKEIKRSDLASKAAQSGYTTKEYEKLLKNNGITIKD